MLFHVQSPKSAWLHVEKSAKHSAEIIGIFIAACDCDLVDVHACEKQEIFSMLHSDTVNTFGWVAPISLPIDTPEIIRISIQLACDHRRRQRFAKISGDKSLRLVREKLSSFFRCKMGANLESYFEQHQLDERRRVLFVQSVMFLVIQKAEE